MIYALPCEHIGSLCIRWLVDDRRGDGFPANGNGHLVGGRKGVVVEGIVKDEVLLAVLAADIEREKEAAASTRPRGAAASTRRREVSRVSNALKDMIGVEQIVIVNWDDQTMGIAGPESRGSEPLDASRVPEGAWVILSSGGEYQPFNPIDPQAFVDWIKSLPVGTEVTISSRNYGEHFDGQMWAHGDVALSSDSAETYVVGTGVMDRSDRAS